MHGRLLPADPAIGDFASQGGVLQTLTKKQQQRQIPAEALRGFAEAFEAFLRAAQGMPDACVVLVEYLTPGGRAKTRVIASQDNRLIKSVKEDGMTVLASAWQDNIGVSGLVMERPDLRAVVQKFMVSPA